MKIDSIQSKERSNREEREKATKSVHDMIHKRPNDKDSLKKFLSDPLEGLKNGRA